MLPEFLLTTVDATSVNADDTICPKLKDQDQDRGFNKFGTNFVYQYYKIDGTISIQDIFEAIKKDIETVKLLLKI